MGFEYRGSRKFQGWKYHDGSRLVDEEDLETGLIKTYHWIHGQIVIGNEDS
jgi:phage gpG-like protein